MTCKECRETQTACGCAGSHSFEPLLFLKLESSRSCMFCASTLFSLIQRDAERAKPPFGGSFGLARPQIAWNSWPRRRSSTLCTWPRRSRESPLSWLWLSIWDPSSGVGEFATHFETYFGGDWDVHWGYDLDFDPWPAEYSNPGLLRYHGLPPMRRTHLWLRLSSTITLLSSCLRAKCRCRTLRLQWFCS